MSLFCISLGATYAHVLITGKSRALAAAVASELTSAAYAEVIKVSADEE
jgi:phage replication-related protein YjqB (UPF0714/DUF867 family)